MRGRISSCPRASWTAQIHYHTDQPREWNTNHISAEFLDAHRDDSEIKGQLCIKKKRQCLLNSRHDISHEIIIKMNLRVSVDLCGFTSHWTQAKNRAVESLYAPGLFYQPWSRMSASLPPVLRSTNIQICTLAHFKADYLRYHRSFNPFSVKSQSWRKH